MLVFCPVEPCILTCFDLFLPATDHIDRTWMNGYSVDLPDMSKHMERDAVAAANKIKVAKAAGGDALHTLSHVAMR